MKEMRLMFHMMSFALKFKRKNMYYPHNLDTFEVCTIIPGKTQVFFNQTRMKTWQTYEYYGLPSANDFYKDIPVLVNIMNEFMIHI